MKVEDSERDPVLDLRKPEATRSQGAAEDVSHVLVNNVGWMPVAPKTFHYYCTKGSGGRPGLPFIQFDMPGTAYDPDMGFPQTLVGKRIELFPTSVAGLAFHPNKEDK